MEKILLVIFCLIGILNTGHAQSSQNSNDPQKTRTVYFFIEQLDSESEATTIQKYLNKYKGKVVEVAIDVTTQMATLEVIHIADQDIVEVIQQTGFNSHQKDSLPPSGFKYVYNPDGTWKLKAL